jgi:hypothetical protein
MLKLPQGITACLFDLDVRTFLAARGSARASPASPRRW